MDIPSVVVGIVLGVLLTLFYGIIATSADPDREYGSTFVRCEVAGCVKWSGHEAGHADRYGRKIIVWLGPIDRGEK